VEDVAVSVGLVLGRRLELRGDRELSFCSACPNGYYPRGHWCFTRCSGRRLAGTDEQAHTERFLFAQKGIIQKAANECLDRKIEEGYKCLGDPEDLTIKIFLSE
jgi:hypothetical protein